MLPVYDWWRDGASLFISDEVSATGAKCGGVTEMRVSESLLAAERSRSTMLTRRVNVHSVMQGERHTPS